METGAQVIAFTKKEGKLGKFLTEKGKIVIEADVTTGGCEFSYVLFNFLAFKIMNNKEHSRNIKNLQME